MENDDIKSIIVFVLLAISIVLVTIGTFTTNKNFGIWGILIATGSTSYCWYKLCKLWNKK